MQRGMVFRDVRDGSVYLSITDVMTRTEQAKFRTSHFAIRILTNGRARLCRYLGLVKSTHSGAHLGLSRQIFG